jgi:hypothetical protein
VKIGPLSLFDNHIAAWHWKWSLTWRWLLSWRRHTDRQLGIHFLRTYCGGGFTCGINTKRLGDLWLYVQPNMRRPEREARG